MIPLNLQQIPFVQVPNLKRVMFVRHQPIGDRLNLPLETMGRYKVTIEKLEKKPEEEKGSKKKNDDTGVPPEHLCTQNEQNIHQEPPPLTAAAKKLINNDIRGSTKKAYKSKGKAFADYCTKEGTNTKSCHPNSGGDNRALMELSFWHVTTKTRAYSEAFGFFRIFFGSKKVPSPCQITF